MSGFIARSKLNLMSSAVSGEPSWNFTPRRNLNVYLRPSGEMVCETASPGVRSDCELRMYSDSNMFALKVWL